MKIYFKRTDSLKTEETDAVKKFLPQRYKDASEYRFEKDRKLSLCASYILISILKPDKPLEVKTNEFGKPYIEGYPYFNISHSGEIAAVAVSDNQCGIDIEKISPCRQKVAEKVFTDKEREILEQSPDEYFTQIWTMKESVMKYSGKGFALQPLNFDVSPAFKLLPVELESKLLYIKTIEFEDYKISLCTDNLIEDIQLIEL